MYHKKVRSPSHEPKAILLRQKAKSLKLNVKVVCGKNDLERPWP